MPDKLSDKKCIKEYLKGNQEAFNMLYERYHRQLYAFLNRLVPQSPHIADDLYQQTWIKAIDNFRKYKDKGKFLSWLFRIAHNLFIDYARKNKSNFDDSEITLYSENITHDEIEKKEFNNALELCLIKLPHEQREVFLLRLNEIPFKEIAKIQNTNINTVLGRMKYAVEKLKNQLKGHM